MKTVIRDISPNDLMFHGGEKAYWGAGEDAVEVIHEAMDRAGVGYPEKVLDLPCGHGRVLRWLRAEWPDAELVACDLDTEAVDFCVDTFAAHKLYSHQHPGHLRTDVWRSFDVIWCGSLLTHLPKPRWYPWLSFFAENLSGVLVFTTGGPFTAEALRSRHPDERHGLEDWQATELLHDYDQTGFGYWDYPKTPNYGLARAKPEWVEALLERLPLELISYEPAGWCARQDVWTCVRDQPA